MCALVPPLFPDFGWPSTAGYESYYLGGENLNNDMFLDFPVLETYGVLAHHQNSLGVSVSSEGNGIDNNPVVKKKLNHNASERDRRKKINSLFASLRSCLPTSDQSVNNFFDMSIMFYVLEFLREYVRNLTVRLGPKVIYKGYQIY